MVSENSPPRASGPRLTMPTLSFHPRIPGLRRHRCRPAVGAAENRLPKEDPRKPNSRRLYHPDPRQRRTIGERTPDAKAAGGPTGCFSTLIEASQAKFVDTQSSEPIPARDQDHPQSHTPAALLAAAVLSSLQPRKHPKPAQAPPRPPTSQSRNPRSLRNPAP